MLVGGALLIVAAIGAGVLVWWLQNKAAPAVPTTAEKQLPQSASNAQDLAVTQGADAANKQIADSLQKQGISNDEKYSLYIQQGANYDDQGQHQQALDSFKKAEAIQQNYTVSHLIAEQAAALGDKQTAIQYYKKTISQLDTKNPLYNQDKQTYEDNIKALGGTP